MTADSDETGKGWLPLKYEDGPDYCTVTFATGAAFALTVHPERMKLMEAAMSAAPVAQEPVAWDDVAEDDPDVVLVAHAIAEHGVGRSWNDFLPVNIYDLDHGDLTEYARAAVAAYRAKHGTPPATSAGVGADEVARGAKMICEDRGINPMTLYQTSVYRPPEGITYPEDGYFHNSRNEREPMHYAYRRYERVANAILALLSRGSGSDQAKPQKDGSR